MTGAPDPLYIQARHVLLDALEALGSQRKAVVLVGAQAIYLHTGESDLAVAPFTSDGDIALDPRGLTPNPKLEELFSAIDGLGSQMAARATEGLEDPAIISASCSALALDLLEAVRGS